MSYFPQYTGINHFNTGSAGTITNANYSNIGNMQDVQEDPQEPRVNTQKTYIHLCWCLRINASEFR